MRSKDISEEGSKDSLCHISAALRYGLTLTAVVIILISIIIGIDTNPQASGHGVPSGGPSGAFVGISNEQFSDLTIDMDNDVLIITGSLESRINREIKLYPYVSVDPARPNIRSDPSDWPRSLYPLFNDPASWYFKIEYNISSPIILQPGEEVDYEIKAYPLKAGAYHIHTYLISDNRYSYNHHLSNFVGRGQTVLVAGSEMPTVGEVTQLYLPFAIGAATLSFLVIRARKVMAKESAAGKVRKGSRFYFAVKASLETIWLSGIVFWLAFAALPVLYPLEERLFTVSSMIAIIFVISAGSYFAAVKKSGRLHRMVAISTAAASAIFCFVLLFGDVDDGGFGYSGGPFDVNGMLLFVGGIANSAVAVLASRRGKHYKAAILTNE